MKEEKELMNIPKGWKLAHLSEIGDITPSNVDKKIRPTEIQTSLCNYMDVYSNDYLGKQTEFSPGSVTNAELLKFKLRKEDVIITKDSETPDDIAIPSVVVDDLENIVCGYHLALIRPDLKKIRGMFLSKALQTDLCRRHFRNSATGSTRYGLSQKAIFTCPVLLPSIEEQKLIADILLTVDRAIEKTEQLIAKYERIKTGLMQDLLTRGIDEEGNIRSEETHAFKDSALGRIPVEWEIGLLKDYLDYISYGFTNPMPTTEQGPFMITAANISEGIIKYETCRLTSQEDFDKILTPKSKPKIDDILITKDGSLGRLAIVDRENICINQSVAVMRVKREKVNNHYFKILLESPKYQKMILDDSGGSTIKHIYITKLDQMLVAVPRSIEEQKSILARIKEINKFISITGNQLENFREIKVGLMQDLLTGKVRVGALIKPEKQPMSI